MSKPKLKSDALFEANSLAELKKAVAEASTVCVVRWLPGSHPHVYTVGVQSYDYSHRKGLSQERDYSDATTPVINLLNGNWHNPNLSEEEKRDMIAFLAVQRYSAFPDSLEEIQEKRIKEWAEANPLNQQALQKAKHEYENSPVAIKRKAAKLKKTGVNKEGSEEEKTQRYLQKKTPVSLPEKEEISVGKNALKTLNQFVKVSETGADLPPEQIYNATKGNNKE